MNKFKSIMASGHTKNRDYLHKLYTDRQVHISSMSSSEQPVEDEKIFYHRGVSFQFCGTGFRTPEKTILFVWVPRQVLGMGSTKQMPNTESTKQMPDLERTKQMPDLDGAVDSAEESLVEELRTVYEDWLLRTLSEPVNELSRGLGNDHKDTREKPQFSMQKVNQRVISRNGCLYDPGREAFRLRIQFTFPLINGHGLNGKSSFKGIKMLLDGICDCLEGMDRSCLEAHIAAYEKQLEIRRFMRSQNLLAFVANGSILPRQGESDKPMSEAIPFQSPDTLKVEIPLSNGEQITGMGLRRGITIITGGGYSGKSTLLDSLEQGIYNHVHGDGREYCLVEESACKICAEDGRYISNVDISPFFSWLPGKGDVRHFDTLHASGSVSQAANIIEAVYGGCKCLLIDEDTSATNFMIRDKMMRKLVAKEPIIPFTDRIGELRERGISTVLVIGGSGEYLQYGDCILMLEDYKVLDRTGEVKSLLEKGIETASALETANECSKEVQSYTWMSEKYLPELSGENSFYLSQSVQIENARYIKIDDFVADITRLTALGCEEQISSITWLIERLFMESGRAEEDLSRRCERAAEVLLQDSKNTVFASRVHKYELWLEQVRGIDLLMAVSRLRGLDLCK